MALPVIHTAHLLRETDRHLVDLLGSLEPREWEMPSIVPGWAVRDIAAHLLDTALRKLSMLRDHWFVERVEIRCAQDVVDLVNRLNREGVAVYRRLSPALLLEMMASACEQSADFHESLDPMAPAAFPVSWAGETESRNWFDIARELTERWHHQQQIRLAVNRPGIMTPRLYGPVLDTFARALPHSYREIEAAQGTRVRFEVPGECGGTWTIRRGPAAWKFDTGPGTADVRTIVPAEIAWRVFTKGITREEALAVTRIEGDRRLGEHLLGTIAIAG